MREKTHSINCACENKESIISKTQIEGTQWESKAK